MEMTILSQSPRDPILDELAREGNIRITPGKHEDLISLENAR